MQPDRLADSFEVVQARVAGFRVPDSPSTVSPQAAGPAHKAFVDAMLDAELWGPASADQLAWELGGGGSVEPEEIEIFHSAGPYDGAHDSCDHASETRCNIYRVVWSLATGKPVGAPTKIEDWDSRGSARPGQLCGAVEPSVEPQTGRLAWVHRCYWPDDKKVRFSELHVAFPRGDGRYVGTAFDGSEHGEEYPQWPAWYSRNLLMFERAEKSDSGGDEVRTLVTVHADGTGERTRAGPQTSPPHNAAYSYGNPRRVGASKFAFGNRVVSFGIIDGVTEYPNPRTHDLDGDAREEFVLPDTWPRFTTCQHPDANGSGTRILCTRHREPEASPGTGVTSLKQLYEFERDAAAGEWTNSQPLFRVEPADLPPPVGVGNCDYLVYKNALYVGSSHVLATVYCSNEDKTISGSRVLLIRLNGAAAPEYFDITKEVEAAFATSPDQAWRGKFPTWRALS